MLTFRKLVAPTREMRNMKLTFATILLLSCTAALAQNRDRASITLLTEPDARLEDGGRLTLNETKLSVGAPPLRFEKSMINVGFSWTHYQFITEDTQPGDFDVETLGLPLRWGSRSKEGLAGSLILTPSLRTDFDGVTWDDVGVSALALGSCPLGDELTVLFGAGYGQSFGRSRFFPAVGLSWTPAPAWKVDLVFPRPSVRYQVASHLLVYAGMEPGGDEWNVRLTDETRNLALEEYRAGFGLDWKITRHIALLAQAGYVFGRALEIREGSRKESERDIADTGFARIGIAYR